MGYQNVKKLFEYVNFKRERNIPEGRRENGEDDSLDDKLRDRIPEESMKSAQHDNRQQ